MRSCQRHAARLDSIERRQRGRCDSGNRETIPGPARGFEDRLILLRQPLELPLDETANIQRQRLRRRGEIQRCEGRSIGARRDQIVHNGGEKQRVTSGTPVKHVTEAFEIGGVSASLPQVGIGCGSRQVVQHNLAYPRLMA
jgi:hypothetical protein